MDGHYSQLDKIRQMAPLSELTRRVLYGAEQIAAQLGHKRLGIAHLLLILAQERRSICAGMLTIGGLDAAALEANLRKRRPVTGGLLNNVIDQAIKGAQTFGSHYVGTDHLLLALAVDRRGARLLRRYGVNPGAIALQMREHLAR